jgi:hypothetical protein
MNPTQGRGLLLAMLDVDPAHEDEFARWYTEEHFPDRMTCPGVLGGRRFRVVDGTPKYLALYDVESPAALESDAYKRIQTTPWTERMKPHFRHSLRNVYVDITPPPPYKSRY